MNNQQHILVVDDEIEMRIALKKSLEKCQFFVDAAHNVKDALKKITNNNYNLIITDMTMPKQSGIEILNYIQENKLAIPVIIITAYGTISTAVDAIKKGAFDFIEKPFNLDALIFLVERALNSKTIMQKLKPTTITKNFTKVERKIITNSKEFQKTLQIAKTVANTNSTVLIEAESGTGKELLARYLHYHSERDNRAFIAVNCAALPETLLESELFGHKKGSFTGAISDYAGKFEQANFGTILLDEISEMQASLQAKLLRVIQEKTITRIGDSKEINLDIRIIATTNRSMLELVEKNQFRADLYFRLNVIPLSIPPLRARKDDIDLLTEYFIEKYSKENGKESLKLTSKTRAILNHYHWQGNVRELENIIERAVVLSDNKEIIPENLLLKHID